MNEELKRQISTLDEESIIERLAQDSYTEEAREIAMLVLQERNTQNVNERIESYKVTFKEMAIEETGNTLRNRNLIIFFLFVIFNATVTQLFFPLAGANTSPLVFFTAEFILLAPVVAAIWKNKRKIFATVLILVMAVIGDIALLMLLNSGGYVTICGWIYAMYFNYKRS
jgi:hypothetical protein